MVYGQRSGKVGTTLGNTPRRWKTSRGRLLGSPSVSRYGGKAACLISISIDLPPPRLLLSGRHTDDSDRLRKRKKMQFLVQNAGEQRPQSGAKAPTASSAMFADWSTQSKGGS